MSIICFESFGKAHKYILQILRFVGHAYNNILWTLPTMCFLLMRTTWRTQGLNWEISIL